MRLPRNPQFEIAAAIIGPDTISVMNRFPWSQFPTEFLFHDETMLKHALPLPGHVLIDIAVGVEERSACSLRDSRCSPKLFLPMNATEAMTSDLPTALASAHPRLSVAMLSVHALMLP